MWLLLATCALQSQYSSCFVMCYYVSLHSSISRASAGEMSYWCHTFMCMHTHRNTYVYEHVYTPFAGSCRNHMFYKNPGEGEERRMTSSDISISATKDTTALKVSRYAVYTSQIKSPDLSQKLHQTSLNTEIMLIYLYWKAHVCCTLC